MASSNIANELASTLQSASIKHHPDPAYDANPSTAASKKTPVLVHRRRRTGSASTDDVLSASASSIPLSALEPPPRKTTLPPLPDLRFEQSYLARIKDAPSWGAVAWITFLDHVLMPLSQGVVWNLLLFGWRQWNGAAKFGGASVGARVRRWWWGVNNWKVPEEAQARRARDVGEFYVGRFGTAQGD